MIDVINNFVQQIISLISSIGNLQIYLGENLGSIKLISLWVFVILVHYLGVLIRMIFNRPLQYDGKGAFKNGRSE